ncbi:hypothetical protein CAPN001_23960 [Capnocytophaga stomatis]|uniref:anaerobic ribonucleoside-triphosphate reductase activating protein n=1 Tax=Capnocytophaga stomatis TaxID=1848904 RepID=UPI001951DEC7|nr:anaerobic ribonucleoside-triphosphate reductase activating protein [Capnocytophaga stomatis]GIJ97827.1 hypothetical protein CAPN001_23960 [Capnocytophaga stomatis]
MLRYSEYDIVLQEVPNEISLCFTITGCPLACKGCHSEHIWNSNSGELLTVELFEKLLDKYEGAISCVLFMGGEWDIDELLKFITIANGRDLKTALYTGLNTKQIARKYPQLFDCLDYIKTGKWIPSLGGLDSKTTNQHLLEIKTGKVLNHFFWRE